MVPLAEINMINSYAQGLDGFRLHGNPIDRRCLGYIGCSLMIIGWLHDLYACLTCLATQPRIRQGKPKI